MLDEATERRLKKILAEEKDYDFEWKVIHALQDGERALECEATRVVFVRRVERELVDARGKHSPIHSAHEGYAVILEELDELWEEVRKKRAERSDERMWNELVQIGAMAQRVAEDLFVSAGPSEAVTE